MRRGPCLCGDPYCPSCGSPGLAEAEAAEERLTELLGEIKASPMEYALIGAIAKPILEEVRKYVDQVIGEYKDLQDQYLEYLRGREEGS